MPMQIKKFLVLLEMEFPKPVDADAFTSAITPGASVLTEALSGELGISGNVSLHITVKIQGD